MVTADEAVEPVRLADRFGALGRADFAVEEVGFDEGWMAFVRIAVAAGAGGGDVDDVAGLEEPGAGVELLGAGAGDADGVFLLQALDGEVGGVGDVDLGRSRRALVATVVPWPRYETSAG
jgi:hypothetical protein